jgi:hypothetical protein
MEAASLGPGRLKTQDLFEELKHAQHPTRRDRQLPIDSSGRIISQSANCEIERPDVSIAH